MKQVERSNYRFSEYMTKSRWASIWSQITTISNLRSSHVLEIGHGPGVLKAIRQLQNIRISTLDIYPDLKLDYVANINNLPFEDKSFDLACAFQVLEHLKYQETIVTLKELKRIFSKNIILSLPNAQTTWGYCIYFSKIGERELIFPRPFWKPEPHDFDGEHYWELNKTGYEIEKIFEEFSKICQVTKHWILWENPYHHFFFLMWSSKFV